MDRSQTQEKKKRHHHIFLWNAPRGQVGPCGTNTHTHINEHRQSHSAQIGRIGTALAWVTSGYFTLLFVFYDPEKKVTWISVSQRRAGHITKIIFMVAMLGHAGTGFTAGEGMYTIETWTGAKRNGHVQSCSDASGRGRDRDVADNDFR